MDWKIDSPNLPEKIAIPFASLATISFLCKYYFGLSGWKAEMDKHDNQEFKNQTDHQLENIKAIIENLNNNQPMEITRCSFKKESLNWFAQEKENLSLQSQKLKAHIKENQNKSASYKKKFNCAKKVSNWLLIGTTIPLGVSGAMYAKNYAQLTPVSLQYKK